MPNNNNNQQKLKNNVRREIEQELIEEFNGSLKQELTQDIVSDIKKSIDQEYKDGIKADIKTELIDDIKKEIQKDQKKVSRAKSFKIFRLYLYLLIVIACFGYVIYRLYQTDNLSIINEKYTRPTTTNVVGGTTTPEISEDVKDLNYYISKYGYILDSLKISNTELLRGSYNVDAISLSDRLVLAYAGLDESDIFVEGIIYSVQETKMKEAYQKLFGTLDGYTQETFTVRGLNYAYSQSNSSYMAIGNIDNSVSYVNNVIMNIKEENDVVVFEVKTYIVKDNEIYNIFDLDSSLMSVQDNKDLSSIYSKLTNAEYRFKINDNGYKLESISAK